MNYGLIGSPLGHSLSPRLHRLLGGYEYELRVLAAHELEDFFRKRDFLGINVTIPYKRAAAEYCDVLSPEAQATGSVNTIVNSGGRLLGYNTDCAGFEYMAQRAGIDFSGKRAAVLGSGGAAAAVRYVAQRGGAVEVSTVSRSGPFGYENLTERRFDIIINATPAGMYPDILSAPVTLSLLPRPDAVLDVVYNPLRTALCRQAAALGIPCEGGLAMLAAQAAQAVQLFTGKAVNTSDIESSIAELTRGQRSIVLTGMAGCGKSTIGATLAAQTGRKLIDTDSVLRQQFGIEIPQVFARLGEAEFRAREAEVVYKAALCAGSVIATGGGSILNAESRAALAANGALVWLKRDIDKCATCGRPLCADIEAARRLYAEREPVYRAAADIAIDNNGSVGDTVAAIIKELEL